MNTVTTALPATVAATAGSEALRGIRAALPVMLGFVPFALVLGAQATQKGFSTLEVPLLTGLNFGGGSEFAAIRLWTSPPPVLLIVAMSLLVNCRHILMGAALAPYLQQLPRRKVLPALFFMCDESWALALADARQRAATQISLPYYLGVSAGLYLTWVLGTALGALLGPVLGNVEQYGFGMAFTAVFLVLLRGMWRSACASLPWLASLLAAASASLPWLASLLAAASASLYLPGACYVAAGAVAGLLAAVLQREVAC